MHKHEQTLLACWVASPSDALTTQLTPEHFTHPEHRKAATVLMTRGWTSDMLVTTSPAWTRSCAWRTAPSDHDAGRCAKG